MSAKFYICDHCGNLITTLHDAGVPMLCCGEKLRELIPNTVEASGEKHLPVVERSGSTLTVTVGAVEHPMVDVHHIQWLYVETAQGGHIRYLHPGEAPRAVFELGRKRRWQFMPTAICMACGRQNSDKTISPLRADTREARSGSARRGRFCYSRTSLVCSISTGHSASRPECCRYASGSIRHAIPQPAESSRGTGISLPGIPFCLQKASSSMTAEVV